MLTGSAADWFEAVIFDEDCTTLDDFKEAFYCVFGVGCGEAVPPPPKIL